VGTLIKVWSVLLCQTPSGCDFASPEETCFNGRGFGTGTVLKDAMRDHTTSASLLKASRNSQCQSISGGHVKRRSGNWV
jgi:hypothetical protein